MFCFQRNKKITKLIVIIIATNKKIIQNYNKQETKLTKKTAQEGGEQEEEQDEENVQKPDFSHYMTCFLFYCLAWKFMGGTNNTPLKELEVAYSLGKPCLKDGDLEQNGPSDLTPYTPLIKV